MIKKISQYPKIISFLVIILLLLSSILAYHAKYSKLQNVIMGKWKINSNSVGGDEHEIEFFNNGTVIVYLNNRAITKLSYSYSINTIILNDSGNQLYLKTKSISHNKITIYNNDASLVSNFISTGQINSQQNSFVGTGFLDNEIYFIRVKH